MKTQNSSQRKLVSSDVIFVIRPGDRYQVRSNLPTQRIIGPLVRSGFRCGAPQSPAGLWISAHRCA